MRDETSEQIEGPAEGAAPPLFVSYARANRTEVQPIIAALEAAGHGVWWDGLIEGGARFAHQTEAALNAAPAVIVVWSAASITSHWVNDEATAARDRGVLVPVTIDGSSAPIGFRQFQVIDLSSWSGAVDAPEFARVLNGIAALGNMPKRPQAPAAMTPAPSRRHRFTTRRGLIAGAAAGAGLLALGGAARYGWLGGGGNGAEDHSIAVLPFETIGGGAERAYFAEGLAAELRSQLTRNQAFRVIGRSSSETAAAEGDGVASIADRLDVAFLLEGTVRWAGNAVRISADLIDTATNVSRWNRMFDLKVDDILVVQAEIAAAVTVALSSELVEPENLARAGDTDNAAAYDHYLRGLDLYRRASSEAMDRAALAEFDASIAADPRFSAAHAARALSLTLIGGLYGSLSETRADYAAALASARRAVALAPERAGSHATLGYVLSQAMLDIRAARQPFERARALGAGDASVLTQYAQFAAQTSRFADARIAVDRAISLDPLNPLTLQISGLIAYWARDYEAALAQFERALRQSPDLGEVRARMGDALLMLGRLAEASAAYGSEPNALLRETGRAIVLQRLGQTADAATARERIVGALGTGQVTHYQQAQIAAQWGETAAAMTALDAARAAGDSGLVMLAVDPLLDPVRRSAGFAALRAALHFD